MKLESMLQAQHLDDIRINKNVTIEDLCDGITDSRQFRRYKSGYSDLPFSKLKAFCDKLKISLNDFYYSLLQKDRKIYSKLAEIYDTCQASDYDEAQEKLNRFSNANGLDNQNKKFYDFLNLYLNYHFGRTSTIDTIAKLKSKCSYEKLKKQKVFDFIDILYINLIMITETNIGINKSVNLLESILRTSDYIYISSENKHILPPIYANLAIYYGQQGNTKKSLALAEEAIMFCRHHSILDSLPSLYYSKTLCYKDLGDTPTCYKAAIECISACLVLGNNQDINLYRNLITKDLGMDPISLFSRVYEITELKMRKSF